MRLEITAQVINEDGEVLWGYSRGEVVIPRRARDAEDVREAMLDIGRELLDGIDTAKDAIGRQIAQEVANSDAE